MNSFKIALASLVASAMLSGVACAKEVNFKGKTIEWIIPFSAGGGSDKWSRFYAPLLSEELPGKPNVIVKNMPGGGSTKGANFFAQRASKKGLTIFGTSGSTQFPYLLGDKRVRYEYKDWNVVLASPTGGVVYVSAELGNKIKGDMSKLRDIELKYGSQGATSLDLVPLLAFELLGLDVKAIFGMKGRKDGRLAFLRGETNIDYQTSASYLKGVAQDVEAGKAVALFSWGALNADGNIVRDPTFPNLPHFGEVYEKINGKAPSGDAYEAWKTFFIAGFPAQKMVFLPKGTSQDIIDTYTEAFKKVISAADFKEKSKVRLGVYPQEVGKEAKKTKELGTNVNEKNRKWIQEWLTKTYNIKF